MKKLLNLILMLTSTMLFSQVGINTTNPTETLHVNGSFRLEDGSEGTNRVLKSDANGVSSWSDYGIPVVLGTLGNGINIAYNIFFNEYTGSFIVLPPGKWAVNVVMVLKTGLISPDDSQFWLQSSFSDDNVFNPQPSPDIEGAFLISGSLDGASRFGLLTGTIVLNNTSGTDKTYYYIVRSPNINNTTQTLTDFGANDAITGENKIIAYRIE